MNYYLALLGLGPVSQKVRHVALLGNENGPARFRIDIPLLWKNTVLCYRAHSVASAKRPNGFILWSMLVSCLYSPGSADPVGSFPSAHFVPWEVAAVRRW